MHEKIHFIMAIYRVGGYATGIIREQPELPPINSPEKGEPLLISALQAIEEYSKSLVIQNNEMLIKIRGKLDSAGEIAINALEISHKATTEFASITENEIEQFDKMVSDIESLVEELQCVDVLHNDICQLSDMLTNVEQNVLHLESSTKA